MTQHTHDPRPCLTCHVSWKACANAIDRTGARCCGRCIHAAERDPEADAIGDKSEDW